MVFLSALLFVAKLRLFAVIASAVFALNLFDVLWLYLPEFKNGTAPESARLTILQMNLNGIINHNYDAAVAEVVAKHPDVVALSEVNEKWLSQLNPRLVDYPHRLAAPEPEGIALYSRLPILRAETKFSANVARPRFYAHLRLGARDIVLDFAHPLLPLIPKYRNDELEQLAADAQSTTLPFILAGDLNCTPWSYYFHRLMKNGKLHDTERGFGPQATFDADLLIPVLPIDHVLTTSQFRTISRTTGPNIGSDHLPVFTELALVDAN